MSVDAAVRHELWLSFVSMVRAYTSARNVSQPAKSLTVDDSRHGLVTVSRPGGLLVMQFDADTGSGSWTELEGSPIPETVVRTGPIRLELDGVIFHGEKRLDFDMAAIELLAEFDQKEKKQ